MKTRDQLFSRESQNDLLRDVCVEKNIARNGLLRFSLDVSGIRLACDGSHLIDNLGTFGKMFDWMNYTSFI